MGVPTPAELPLLRRREQWLLLGLGVLGLGMIGALFTSLLAARLLPLASPLLIPVLIVPPILADAVFVIATILYVRRASTPVRHPTAAADLLPGVRPGGASRALLFAFVAAIPFGFVLVGSATGPFSVLPFLAVLIPCAGAILLSFVMQRKRKAIVDDLHAGRFASGLARLARSSWFLGHETPELRAALLSENGEPAAALGALAWPLSAPGHKLFQVRRTLLRIAALRALGRMDEAEADARWAVSLVPHLPWPNAVLAECALERSADPAELADAVARLGYAIDAQRRSLVASLLDPVTLPRIATIRARALACSGAGDEARQALAEGVLPTGPVARAEILWHRARAFEALGDTDAAGAALREGAALPGQAARSCAARLARTGLET